MFSFSLKPHGTTREIHVWGIMCVHAHPCTQAYPDGWTQYMPSAFRVTRSTRVTIANTMDTGRITKEGCFDPNDCSLKPTALVAAGYVLL